MHACISVQVYVIDDSRAASARSLTAASTHRCCMGARCRGYVLLLKWSLIALTSGFRFDSSSVRILCQLEARSGEQKWVGCWKLSEKCICFCMWKECIVCTNLNIALVLLRHSPQFRCWAAVIPWKETTCANAGNPPGGMMRPQMTWLTQISDQSWVCVIAAHPNPSICIARLMTRCSKLRCWLNFILIRCKGYIKHIMYETCGTFNVWMESLVESVIA